MFVDTYPPSANAFHVSQDLTSLHHTAAVDDDRALDVRSHAERVGAILRSALEEVVHSISGPTPRPAHLITRVGLDKTIAGRIIQTIRAPDALSALMRCPASNGLGIFIRAAKLAGTRAESIAKAEEAIASLERLLTRFPRGRTGLDAAISGWIPEAREQGERIARQSAFKAMSFIFGHQSEATLASTFLKPSADGQKLDVAFVGGQFGLRRLRVGEPFSVFGRRLFPQVETGASNMNPTTLDGHPVGDAPSLLDEFCIPNAPKLELVKTKDQILFVLPADFPEINEPISLVLAHAQASNWCRFASPKRREEWLSVLVRCPTRVLINDTFIRDDVYPGVEPIVTTHIVGMTPLPASERDPAFPLDEVHLKIESGWIDGHMRDIGTGDIPRYPELISDVFRRTGEDPRRYRIHRLRMHYPVYGIGATRWFKLPENPNQSA